MDICIHMFMHLVSDADTTQLFVLCLVFESLHWMPFLIGGTLLLRSVLGMVVVFQHAGTRDALVWRANDLKRTEVF